MRSRLVTRPTVGTDLGSMLEAWSRAGNTSAIAALCDSVANSDVELLETTFFSLLDKDDRGLASTLEVLCTAIGRARRTQGTARTERPLVRRCATRAALV